MMMFCPKCGSILVPKTKNGKVVTLCSCGFKGDEKESESMSFKEQVAKEKDIEVISDDKDADALPEADCYCSKCGHNKAGYWLAQTRSADEPATKFMKCKKCGKVWRDYS